MSRIADLYEQLRQEICELVSGLQHPALDMPVPATPGWNIKDVVAHLAADATYAIRGELPRQFFEAYGDTNAVVALNDWTGRQLEERKHRSLQELLDEWSTSGNELAAIMRAEKPWPDGSLMFTDRILATDAAVHQQDILGALGIAGHRDGAGVKVGLRTYIAGMGSRLVSSGLPPLRFDIGAKSYTAGEGEPAAVVRGTSFELFRAMSGRRSPAQIEAYEWEGDAHPYIPYFYPYGIREEALVE